MVWSEIASYLTSLMSKGKIRTMTIKKRWITNKTELNSISFSELKIGIKTLNPDQTMATIIIFK